MKRRNFLKALPAAALALAGCGQAETAPANTASLVFDHSYPLDYAAQFSADCYEGGYVLVNIPDSGRFLVIPEDAAEVDDLPADVVPLRQPLDNIYLVSTSVMDLFVHLDALDCIALSGTKAEGWYVEEAKQAMQDFVRINKEYKISILLNIHHVELALKYCDRVIGIRNGTVAYAHLNEHVTPVEEIEW